MVYFMCKSLWMAHFTAERWMYQMSFGQSVEKTYLQTEVYTKFIETHNKCAD